MRNEYIGITDLAHSAVQPAEREGGVIVLCRPDVACGRRSRRPGRRARAESQILQAGLSGRGWYTERT